MLAMPVSTRIGYTARAVVSAITRLSALWKNLSKRGRTERALDLKVLGSAASVVSIAFPVQDPAPAAVNPSFPAAFRRPIQSMLARFVKLSAQFDF
jgi:hypothetical protein